MMPYQIKAIPEKILYGLAVRTSSAAPGMREALLALWTRAEQVLPEKAPRYCVYTDYAPDGSYDAVVCAEWDAPPAGMRRVAIPSGEYAVYTFGFCGPQEDLGRVWEEIQRAGLPRAYLCDWEAYPAPDRAEIWLSVARLCQSCGMPMQGQAYGREADGSESRDYCAYCYQNGRFAANCTMEQMIDFCAGPMLRHNPALEAEEARAGMRALFPTLKRWKEG